MILPILIMVIISLTRNGDAWNCQATTYALGAEKMTNCPSGITTFEYLKRSRIECSLSTAPVTEQFNGFSFYSENCQKKIPARLRLCEHFTSGSLNTTLVSLKVMNWKTCIPILQTTNAVGLVTSAPAYTSQIWITYVYTFYTSSADILSGTDGDLTVNAVWTSGFVENFVIYGRGLYVFDLAAKDKVSFSRQGIGDLVSLSFSLTQYGIGPDWLWSTITVADSYRRMLWTFLNTNNVWMASVGWKMNLTNPAVSYY